MNDLLGFLSVGVRINKSNNYLYATTNIRNSTLCGSCTLTCAVKFLWINCSHWLTCILPWHVIVAFIFFIIWCLNVMNSRSLCYIVYFLLIYFPLLYHFYYLMHLLLFLKQPIYLVSLTLICGAMWHLMTEITACLV